MGFRSRRRHKGGGGGGGGHHGGGQAFAFTGEANGLQPGDDVGNKKSFKPVIVPPEDLGNRRDPDEDEHIPFDDVGNRVEANPTHEISGVLLDLDPKKRKGRARGNAAPIERNGRYVIGGVNPLIAGGNRPPPPPPADDNWDAPQQQQQQQQRPQQQQQQQQPRSEKKKRFEQVDGAAAQEVSEKRAQRFFDFDEDDRFDYTLKSTPEQKRKEALRFVDDILRESGRNASVKARVIDDGDKPKLLVTIDEKGPHARVERLGEGAAEPLFVMGNGALLSLNYLANKVVNRYPDDRIRLAVLPASDEALYLESLDEHQKKKRGETVLRSASSSEATSPSTALPAEAPLALEIAVGAPVDTAPVVDTVFEAAPAPAPKKGKKAAAAVEAPAPAPVAPVAAPIAPIAEPDVDDGPKKKASRRKPKKGEELIPPPSAATIAAIEAGPAAVADVVAVDAPTPEPVVEAVEAEAPVEPEAPKGRRRAPPLEEPVRVRAPLDDGPRGGGPPRGRPRRGPSMVEVVRVSKKT